MRPLEVFADISYIVLNCHICGTHWNIMTNVQGIKMTPTCGPAHNCTSVLQEQDYLSVVEI